MKNRLKFTVVTLLIIGIGPIFPGYEDTPVGKFESGLARAGSASNIVPARTGSAKKEVVTEWYEAVGTVRPRTETRIEAQVTAQILDVRVRPGDRVLKDQLLISLDSRQLKSRLDQARQALTSAVAGKEQARQAVIAVEAAFKQAELEYNRTKTYFESQAATAQDLERVESLFLQARANSITSRTLAWGIPKSKRRKPVKY
jgi:multidrug efflux pump subunit AcrA (membrane-fusion protein)